MMQALISGPGASPAARWVDRWLYRGVVTLSWSGFFPRFTKGGSILDYFQRPPAVRWARTTAIRRISRILKSTPEVGKTRPGRTGMQLGLFRASPEANNGDFNRQAGRKSVNATSTTHCPDIRSELRQHNPPQIEFISFLQAMIGLDQPAPSRL